MRLFSSKLLTAIALICLLNTGCGKNCDSAGMQPSPIPPSGLAGTGDAPGSINLDHPPAMGKSDQKALAEAQKNRPIITGKVVEAIYKEGFAYVRLEGSADSSTWIAIVNQKPTVGQTISVQEQAVLTDFHSKSLDRTFEKIIFGSIVE